MAYLTMDGITKTFGTVRALNDVDLAVERASIHAIIGENGAGKSTLMKILYGLEEPDRGTISIDGGRCHFDSPREAMERGIGMVHQHFQQVPSFSVLENVILGQEPTGRGVVHRQRAHSQLRELMQGYGFELDLTSRVADLSMGERQQIEIVKLLYRQADVLIFDEATSVLTPHQAESLFSILEQFRENGKTIIYITHKLDEVLDLADRVTVLRQGEVAAATDVASTDKRELARAMVGSSDVPVDAAAHAARAEAEGGTDPVAAAGATGGGLKIRGLWYVLGSGVPALQGLDLDVAPGELVGIAGIEGNGQEQLAGCIAGVRKPGAGTISLDGRSIDSLSVRQRRHSGIGWIPPDRYQQGSALKSPLTDNLVADRVDGPPAAQQGILQTGTIRSLTEEKLRDYDVRAAGPEAPAEHLSGGNLQKLIVAREIRPDLKVLVASTPTHGLDIQAAAFVRSKLVELRNSGVGVLLISSDLDEVLALSDRILVIHQGRIRGSWGQRDEFDREDIGLAMTGGTPAVLGGES